MKHIITVGGVVLALGVLSGCGGEPQSKAEPKEPETFFVRGTMRLIDHSGINYEFRGKRDELCWGEDGYSDVSGRASVVIRNSGGERIGLGSLGPGRVSDNVKETLLWTCDFAIAVDDVPIDGEIYTVEVASRGEVTFKLEDAESLEVSLG
ncbi:hypothetical protein [Nocardioides sp. InS609-2]|uniref:hypothetical protein n=1 Tax=Nocardioides sp. InS609-2 TaxID=2760705 RepID=UPI0020BE87B7|nr:hypothetical protein [Nocardioides sp. InS609-2]